MLRRRSPLCYEHILMSDSETESDDLSEHFNAQTSLVKRLGKQIGRKSCRTKRKSNEKSSGRVCGATKALKEDPEVVVKMARDYQELMKQIPVPMTRRKDAIFVSWLALANSMKQFYGQPLHYLTHVLVKQWDQSRIGTVDAEKPIGDIIHPRRAESTIWDVEEVHRRCTSYTHLANPWLSDPEYHAFVHEVVPSSKSVA